MPSAHVRAVWPPGGLTPHQRGLFWFRAEPPELDDPDDARTALATVLREGLPEDWAPLNLVTLASLLDDVPLMGWSAAFWRQVCAEASSMEQRDQVITPAHHAVLGVAAATLAPWGFELAGGTALAAGYLGHRRTRNLDFVTGQRASFTEGSREFIEALVQQGHSVDQTESLSPTMRRLTASGITIDLAVDAPFRLAASTTSLDAMPLRSLRDLAADTTLALFDRATTRDFVDVYVLLQRYYEFGDLPELAASKDTGFDPGWFARALQHAARLNPADVDLLVPINFPAMQQRFLDEAVRLTALRGPQPKWE